MDQKNFTNDPSEESTVKSETFSEYDLETFYKPILDELILDAIWNVCFEVHRAAQHEIHKGKNLDGSKTDSSGQKNKNPSITCPNCNKATGAAKYTTHLFQCYGLGGRSCSRTAKTKLTEASYNEEEEDIVEKIKKSRKKQGKKTKPLNKEQSSSKPNLTLEDLKGMSLEKREEFFSKNCGTITKKTKKSCMNPYNCKTHNDEARRNIRFLLGINGDKTTNDEQIDIDTVDEGKNADHYLTGFEK